MEKREKVPDLILRYPAPLLSRFTYSYCVRMYE